MCLSEALTEGYRRNKTAREYFKGHAFPDVVIESINKLNKAKWHIDKLSDM